MKDKMVLRMKNPTFTGGGRVSRKTNIEGGDCLKRGAWTVYGFKGVGWQERQPGVLEGGLIPQCTL